MTRKSTMEISFRKNLQNFMRNLSQISTEFDEIPAFAGMDILYEGFRYTNE